MRRVAASSIVLGAVLLTGCATGTTAGDTVAPVGHAELQLVGDWTGTGDENGEGVLDMHVMTAADDGSAFDGQLTFAAAGSSETEAVHAAMTPNGHLVAAIGEDASVEVHIVDPATLDYCFIRYGTDSVHACGRLVRGD